MHRRDLKVLFACFALLSLTFVSGRAQTPIAVDGVADKQTYTDIVTVQVPSQAGFETVATLNEQPFPLNEAVILTAPDYYELRVVRTPTVGAAESRLIRFLVVAAERVGTEWGLPPHVPSPLISSARSEFQGGHLRLMMPSRLPLGMELPVIAWIESEDAHAIRVNGALAADGFPDFWIRRGVGSAVQAMSGPARTLVYHARVGGLAVDQSVVIEDTTSWQSARGVLGSQTEWPAGGSIHVTGNLTIPAGGTLRIGAGCIIRLDPQVDFTNNGKILILGTRVDPVLFAPTSSNKPWGGFVMRAGTGEIDGTGVIFVGSGADATWFSKSGNPGSHRKEQALFFVNDNQRIRLKDAAAVSLAGQLGHAVKGGEFVFEHFLMQRTTSGGEFTGAKFSVNDSAFIECPADSTTFVDGDNDALYLVSGEHGFTNTLFGWTKDDGVDSGGSGVGKLRYQSCWFEATFHEGNSLSGAKDTIARDTVYLDCGQGLEDGYEAPVGVAEHCLFLANEVGVRHGDNYPNIGRYDGRITATNCLLLNNHRDVFGFNWRSSGWTNATGQMLIRDNWLTRSNAYFPDNRLWNPSVDASALAAFGARDAVGVGFATRGQFISAAQAFGGIPVRLSMACTREVIVRYVWEDDDGSVARGALRWTPGEIQSFIPVASAWEGLARVRLVDAEQAEITGSPTVIVQRFLKQPAQLLVKRGAIWKYRDDAVDLGQTWRLPGLDDAPWSQGPAPMGYGDGAEGTVLRATDSGPEPRPLTYYFRTRFTVVDPSEVGVLNFAVRRDDGVVVHLNGEPLFRMNMPDLTEIKYSTLASTSVADETSYFPTNLPAFLLLAGTNLLAVELHQSSPTSGDAHFDLELRSLPPEPPLVLRSAVWADAVYLFWDRPEARLTQSTDLHGPWTPILGAASPWSISGSGSRFFRLE